MLENVFLQILNMSFTGGIIILFVLAARFALRRAPKVFSYTLWAVALFRLVCPFSFESVLSLLPTNPAPIRPEIVYSKVPRISTGIPILDNTVSTALPAATPAASVNPLQILALLYSCLWLLGIAVLLIYSVVSLVKLQKRLHSTVLHHDNIYLSNAIDTPFVMGLVRPKIYLPSSIGVQEKQYIILHEQTHIRRLDHVAKMLRFFVLCLHWFNPLVWVAFFLSGKDMEMSCDEAVIKKLGATVKADYSSSLLSLATGRRIVGATPLAFGEGDTKGRSKNVLTFKKPTAWGLMIAVIAVTVLCVGLVTNPKNDSAEKSGVDGLWENRTQYVGNNSAVANIISELSFAQNLQYDGFTLDTKAPPYGITVKLKTDTQTLNYYTGAQNEAPLKKKAIILFSLIENADMVVFTLYDGKNPYSVDYTREWAENYMGATNLFAKTETFEGFGAFINDVSIAVGTEIESNGKNKPDYAATQYDKVKVTFDMGISGFGSQSEYEGTDSKTVAYIDTVLASALTPSQKSDLDNNDTNQYVIELSNNMGGYSCKLYYDALYNDAYLMKDGGLYEIDTDFARYIDSLLEARNIDLRMNDDDAVTLFNEYGWTLDYQISTMSVKLHNIKTLSEFNSNAYYFAYNNELSKDIGLDMSSYSDSANIDVYIYKIHESMPKEFYPIQDCRGVVVKSGRKIIGAFISAGRHSALNACSLKGNRFETAAKQTLYEWLADKVKVDKTEEHLSTLAPVQIIEEYFTALDKKDGKKAQSLMSRATLLGDLTANMPDDELFNEQIGLPLTDADIGAKTAFDNLKSAKLLNAELIDEPASNVKIFRVTVNLQYNEEVSIGSGEQDWDCRIVYESPQTGFKIESFGH